MLLLTRSVFSAASVPCLLPQTMAGNLPPLAEVRGLVNETLAPAADAFGASHAATDPVHFLCCLCALLAATDHGWQPSPSG
jgi:hypothetical protein